MVVWPPTPSKVAKAFETKELGLDFGLVMVLKTKARLLPGFGFFLI
jgi:hypothetical protein